MDNNTKIQLLNIKSQLQMNEMAALATFIVQKERKRKQQMRRRWWQKPWLERRTFLGEYTTLMQELMNECHGDFRNYLRMEPEMFHELYVRITPRIRKSRRHRTPLDPGLKLAITLRYLATGNSYKTLAYSFRVAHNTISILVPEVCRALVEELQPECFKFPQSPDDWKEIAKKYSEIWNFHHCIGALDGKHVAIRSPKTSGSLFYNYKGFFSIILLGLVDADYKFIWADVGAQGSASDAQIFNHSTLKSKFEERLLSLPDPEPLPNDDYNIPYFMVGDDAFPLRTWLQKPYSARSLGKEERIFNYRLSRARRIVENAFGILAHRWRCLLSTMQQEPPRAKQIVMATICLHNMMRMKYPTLQNRDYDTEAENGIITPGAWRGDTVMQEVNQITANNQATKEGKKVRTYLKHYYNNIGRVSWQESMI